jgi:3D-(3,5/4)-trihydroxycyclohexane-1,2-dione acylhydrolase (decyclizing)
MMPSEIVTAVQEDVKLVIVLVDNRGFSSIGSLSRSLGTDGFGTLYRYRRDGSLGTDSADSEAYLPVDLAANAESLGARVIRAETVDALREALVAARADTRTTVIAVATDRYEGVPGYESWWDVPVAEVAESESVRAARRDYETARASERHYL